MLLAAWIGACRQYWPPYKTEGRSVYQHHVLFRGQCAAHD